MAAKNAPRPMISARERGPGPGRYGLPSTVGYINHDVSKVINPAYSIGKRLNPAFMASDCGPGPAHAVNSKVTRHGPDGTPHYSILGKLDPLYQFKTPSPCVYKPEAYPPPTSVQAPSYSLGSRTRYRNRDPIPPPNSYRLPSLLGSSQPLWGKPRYSMLGRSNIGCFSEDLAKAPGPGRYDAPQQGTYKLREPHYSIQSKNYMPGDSSHKPGPSAYRPENVYIDKPIAPKYSLGMRHSEYVTQYIE